MSVAVVHLARAANGFEPFARFMDSYERHPAGLDHELVLLLKGFGRDDATLGRIRARAVDHGCREVHVDDTGLDLGAYAEAARRLEHQRVCFLNSFSQILAPGWLGLLAQAATDSGAGAAGATASWGSHLSWCLYQLGLGGRLGQAFPGRKQAREALEEVTGGPPVSAVQYWLYSLWTALRQRRGGRFPNPHLRTNGFLVERQRFVDACGGALTTKWDTYRMESGPRSLTSRLRALGIPPVLVDRRGDRFAVADWHRADVFCQSGQEDLLIADNQTASYARATPAQRRALSAFAWGPWARPG